MADSGSCDLGNYTIAMTLMGNEAAQMVGLRGRRFDQLGADSASMWAVALTSPTVMAAQGIRMVTESGSGRTRAETNNPPNTAAPGAA